MNAVAKSDHMCVVYIQASRERVWNALTSAEFTSQYFHQTEIESTWQPGADVVFYNKDRSIAVKGQVIEAKHPSKLSFSWHVHYNPVAKKESPSRVTYLLETVDDSTQLTVIHDQFPAGSVVLPQITEGWIKIVCNLKTLLETGKTMAVS